MTPALTPSDVSTIKLLIGCFAAAALVMIAWAIKAKTPEAK